MTAPQTTAKVLAALSTTEWRSPRTIADAVGAGYSTVTAVLRDLETSNDAIRGHVTNTGETVPGAKTGRPTVWRAPVVVDVLATAADIANAPDALDEWAAQRDDHAVVGNIDIPETRPASVADALTGPVDVPADTPTPWADEVGHVDANVTAPDPVETPEMTAASDAANDAWAAGVDPDGADDAWSGDANDDGPAPADDMDALVAALSSVPPATVEITPAVAAFSPAVDIPWHDMRTPAEVAPVSAPPAAPVSAPPAGAGLDDVLGFMTAVRPLPAAAPETETAKAPRTRRTPTPADRRNDWGNGGLQPAILTWFAGKADGYVAGPSEIANDLKAHTSSVAYSLKQLTKKGQTVRLDGSVPRFRVADATPSE